MTIDKRKLGIKEDGQMDVVNVKCEPNMHNLLHFSIIPSRIQIKDEKIEQFFLNSSVEQSIFAQLRLLIGIAIG